MIKLHNSAYLLFGFLGLCVIYFSPRVECFGGVLELGPDFLLKKAEGGMWFVKFYAPWCGYCKKLEPTWSELEKRVRPLGVVVARIDATRFEELAHQFEIRGFPTLIFFKGDKQFTYSGPRTLDNLEEFVKRVSGPAVDEITTVGNFVQLRHSEKPFFLYYGDLSPISPLFDAFRTVADSMQEKTYFKSLQKTEFLPNDMKSDDHFVKNSVAVVKGATFYRFEEPSENVCKLEAKHEECVDVLMMWIKKERLPNYSAVTPETFHDFQSSGNMLAIAIVPESAPNSDSISKWAKRIADDFRPSYSSHFSFGFMRDPKMFHDITLDSSVEFPNFFVLDTSTDHYYIPEVKSAELTEGSMMHFLDDVKSGKVEPRGGSSFFRKFRRAFHELSKALSELFSVSMVLALLVLSVPLIVVSCLCYLLCTMDTSDDGTHSEDDEDESRRQGSVEDGMGHYEDIHGAEAVEGLRQRTGAAGPDEEESDI